MARNSWCLVRMPKYFKPTGDSQLSGSSSNLTLVKEWIIKGQSADEGEAGYLPFRDTRLYLTYHGDEDVWPWHTNNFLITDVEAPYGQQNNWDIAVTAGESDGFRGYMACGNPTNEGESGETWDPLQIVNVKEGFDSGSVDPETTKEREIDDFTFTFRLDSNYPVGQWCTVTIEWNSNAFLVDKLTMNGVTCSVSSSAGVCIPGKYIPAGSDLVFVFSDVYVKTEVAEDITVTSTTANFVKDIYVNGDWAVYGSKSKTDSWNGYVYYCTDLDSSGEDCDNVQ